MGEWTGGRSLPWGPPLPVLSLLVGFWVCAVDMVVPVWTGCPGCDCPSTDVVVPEWTGCPGPNCPGVYTCIPLWMCCLQCRCQHHCPHRAQPAAPVLAEPVGPGADGPSGAAPRLCGARPSPLIASAAQAGQGRSQECDSGGAGVAVAAALSARGSDRSFPAWPGLAGAGTAVLPRLSGRPGLAQGAIVLWVRAGRGWWQCQH